MYSIDDADGYKFKIVVTGDSAVGKSNLIARFIRDEFDMNSAATYSVEFRTKCLQINDEQDKAQIWDTAGVERFRGITTAYYRGSDGAVLVYDIFSCPSFDSIARWLDDLNKYCDEAMLKMLVGNKSDLDDIRPSASRKARILQKSTGCSSRRPQPKSPPTSRAPLSWLSLTSSTIR